MLQFENKQSPTIDKEGVQFEKEGSSAKNNQLDLDMVFALIVISICYNVFRTTT